ncbi:MAG: hypothetical protein ACK5PU_02080, partial [bacterium]
IVLSVVSAYGAKLAIWVTQHFWLIVTPRKVNRNQQSSAPPVPVPAEKLVRDIRRATRKHHSAEDKSRFGQIATGAGKGTEKPKLSGDRSRSRGPLSLHLFTFPDIFPECQNSVPCLHPNLGQPRA